MLHATLAAAAPLGLHVLALHVHHGLSENADRWLAQCEDRCRRWARAGHPVEFVAHRVSGRPRSGESVEAWARRERYRALAAMAQARAVDLVLLGHHRRDQAETFLLQALRGGGVAALSAMPAAARRVGVTWARPWLAEPREVIEAYLRRHRLRWLDDDTNADQRFARNRLRTQVWPALLGAFADAESALASAARRAQQAAAALDEHADADMAEVADDEMLDVAAWRELPVGRRSNVLRAWLHARLQMSAPATLLDRLVAELGSNGMQRWPAPGGELRSYRGRLRWQPSAERAQEPLPMRAPSTRATPGPGGAAMSIPSPMPMRIDLSEPGTHDVASWHGAFRVERVADGGIPAAAAARLELRPRSAADRFQAGPGRPPRSLKLQFQSAGVPVWQRQGPVLCSGGDLVFVAGLGIDARASARSGEARVALSWLPG